MGWRPPERYGTRLLRRLWREFDINVEVVTQELAVEWLIPGEFFITFTFNDLRGPARLFNWQACCITCLHLYFEELSCG